MPKVMQCDIVTPEKSIYSGEASFVSLPTTSGEIGVLPGHAPLLAVLGAGEVRLKNEAGTLHATYAIAGGYVEIDGARVIILADHAREVSEIDLGIISERIHEMERELAQSSLEADRKVFLEEELAWCRTQQAVAR